MPPKIKTLEDFKTANKKYCKTYYIKKKHQIKNQTEELSKLIIENNKLKQQNVLLIKELTEIKEKLDKDLDEDEISEEDKDSEEDSEEEDLEEEEGLKKYEYIRCHNPLFL